MQPETRSTLVIPAAPVRVNLSLNLPPRPQIALRIVADLSSAWSWLTDFGAEHQPLPSIAAADDLWRAPDPRPILAAICDPRTYVVRAALAARDTSEPHPSRLFTRAGLLTHLNTWTDAIAAVHRLQELAAQPAPNASPRLLVLRAEDARDPDTIRRLSTWLGMPASLAHLAPPNSAAPDSPPLWKLWLTEDDKALIRQSAGSLLVDLGYVGKHPW